MKRLEGKSSWRREGGRKIVETSTTKDGPFNRKLYEEFRDFSLFFFFLFYKR